MPRTWSPRILLDDRTDHGWSWVIAVCCCLVTFGTFGLNRASGVYYVGVIESYGVSREVASWPFSCCGAVNCFSGLISGFMFHFLTIRQVIFSGVGLSTLGLFLSYFANDIIWITVSYGVVFGLGIGFTIVSMPLIINQYFVRHKTSATGIFLAGGTLGSFFVPPLAEYFLETYDLRGTFLLSAALPLQVLVFACFLKAKPSKTLSRVATTTTVTKPTLENNEVIVEFRTNRLDKDDQLHSDTENDPLTSSYENEHREENGQLTTNKEVSYQSEKQEQVTPLRVQDHAEPTLEQNGNQLHDDQVYQSTTVQLQEKTVKEKLREVAILLKKVLTNPMFGIITFSNVSCHFLILTFSMITVDLGLDKGLERHEAVALASVVAVPELIGRLCFGWVSDKGYVSRKHLLVTAQIFAGSLLCIMTLTNDKYFLFTLCGLFGFALGNAFILINVFYMQIMKPEELGLAIAMKHFFTGFVFLLRPTITGIFRDDIGSYSYLLWMLGALSISAGALWKIESYLHYNRTIKEVIKIRKEKSNSKLIKVTP